MTSPNSNSGSGCPIDHSSIKVAPAIPKRHAMHPELTPENIALLVDEFYGEIREHPRLGPIFEQHVAGEWDRHLERMKQFWRSVLLRTGEYSGKPVPVHMALTEVKSTDFRLWLQSFRQVALRTMPKNAAPIVIETAQRIAQSLWLAKFASPFDKVPDWLTASDAA